jgi:pyruvate dehydrogenase E2 component (dihydrolipoamide acetyltransferase)
MIREVFMPALSSTMTEGKIVSWTKSPGDKVAKGETILIVESDKADMDVEAFYEGFLGAIVVNAGDSAAVGATIGYLAETEAELVEAQSKAKGSSASAPAATPATAPVSEPVAVSAPVPAAPVETALNGGNGTIAAPPATAPVVKTGRLVASPRARKLAKQLQVNLDNLVGSGPFGRIVAADVELAVGKTPTPTVAPTAATPAAATPAPAPTPAAAIPAAALAGEVVPFTTLQQAVTRNMVASLSVPVFRAGYTITTDALDSLYKQIKGKGVTMTALLAKAVAVAIGRHPIINASYTEQGLKYNSQVNVAIAVAMPDGGLITPVLQNADKLDIYTLSRNWKDLVDRARAKQLQPDEYSTGTFTLSNLGMFGVDKFDAILPPGQGSILAVGASRPQMVVTDDGLFGVKRQMQVNITCDHRIIYGADGAAFLQTLAKLMEKEAQSLTL